MVQTSKKESTKAREIRRGEVVKHQEGNKVKARDKDEEDNNETERNTNQVTGGDSNLRSIREENKEAERPAQGSSPEETV